MRCKLKVLLFAILALTFAGSTLAHGGEPGHTHDAMISIDNVTNTCSAHFLDAGMEHVVSIRYDARNNDASGFWTGGNQYEIWSPEGADWVRFEGQRGPALELGILALPYARHWESVDRTNPGLWVETVVQPPPPDTFLWVPAGGSQGVNSGASYSIAAVSFANGFRGGPEGTNDIGVTLTFETRLEDAGMHMCVDTAAFATTWEWFKGSSIDFPLWDNGLSVIGPRCWEIYSWPNLPPEWCSWDPDNLSFPYCQSASYQLCAVTYGCPPTPPYYHLVAPYDDGNYGAVDPSSGLWTWSGPTVQPGYYDIEFQVNGGEASSNFHLYVEVTDCDCCVGRVGDANVLGGDEPTISDISTMIDALFISGEPAMLPCLAEADINQSGGMYPTTDNITLGDISTLIDYLFITGSGLGLPDCM